MTGDCKRIFKACSRSPPTSLQKESEAKAALRKWRRSRWRINHHLPSLWCSSSWTNISKFPLVAMLPCSRFAVIPAPYYYKTARSFTYRSFVSVLSTIYTNLAVKIRWPANHTTVHVSIPKKNLETELAIVMGMALQNWHFCYIQG